MRDKAVSQLQLIPISETSPVFLASLFCLLTCHFEPASTKQSKVQLIVVLVDNGLARYWKDRKWWPIHISTKSS